MSRVAIVADSASDLQPDRAQAAGITVVPLLVYFGDREYRAGIDLSYDDFWRELTRPGAPFPTTAAASPGSYRDAYKGLFDGGADEIVYVATSSKLSATIESGRVAREMFSDRAIHIVDSQSASMGTGLLALLGAQRANEGKSGEDITAELERRKGDLRLFLALETLDYLKRGGRISPARAAVGNLLSIKPIITIEDGEVDTADRPRTRSRARERVLELLASGKPEMVAVLHGEAGDIQDFARDLAARIHFPRERMLVELIGPSVGPHVGPGVYGAVILPVAKG
jgi:fatty acid kinase fatty acid binding subunit